MGPIRAPWDFLGAHGAPYEAHGAHTYRAHEAHTGPWGPHMGPMGPHTCADCEIPRGAHGGPVKSVGRGKNVSLVDVAYLISKRYDMDTALHIYICIYISFSLFPKRFRFGPFKRIIFFMNLVNDSEFL